MKAMLVHRLTLAGALLATVGLPNAAPAQYRLGTLLERGTGVTADLEDARLW